MLSNQPRGYQFGKRSELILASFIEKWNDVNLSFHRNDRNISISVDKNYYPTKVTGIDILQQTILRVVAVHKSLPVAEAQVGTMIQRRGAITELGEFRRKDHSPDVLSCPSHADSVSTSPFLERGSSPLERAKRKSRKFEAGIRFQIFVAFICDWCRRG